MSDERHVEESLGAYVLGALDPADRREVEAHVGDCARCRDELAALSGMPALLDRLTPEEATSDLRAVPASLAPELTAAAAGAVRDMRRQVRRWRAAAAAAAAVAAVVGVLAVAPWQTAPEPVVVALQPVAADASSVDGTVSTYAWEWGTTVEVQVANLPERSRYVVWVIDDAGERQEVGTWGPTRSGSASVHSASAVPRERIAVIEVRDDNGDLVLATDAPS